MAAIPQRLRRDLAGLATAGLGLVPMAGCASDAAELPVAESRRTTLIVTLRESGDVEAVRSTDVKAPRDFRDDLVLVELLPEGTRVDSGEVVARLDAAWFADELARSRVALSDARAELVGVRARVAANAQTLDNAVEKAELALELARIELENRRFESETAREEARLQVDEAVLAVTEAESKKESGGVADALKIRGKELDIAKLERELSGLERDFEGLTLRAPTSGIVVYEEMQIMDGVREPRPGDTVFPGSVLLSIPDLSRMQVVFGVAEVDRPKVAPGTPVRLRLEADASARFEGRIVAISGLALPTLVDERVRAFQVTAEIDGTDPRLRPGMTAVVEVVLSERVDVVAAPRGAVFERDGEPVVFPEDTWPEPTAVTLGAGTDQEIEITSGLPARTALVTRTPSDDVFRPLGYARFLAGGTR